MGEQLTIFGLKNKEQRTKNVVNVASVPQRSPFRYPGGKTWLVPIARKWLLQNSQPSELIEPFAGGGIISLTAAFENLSKHVTMYELDEEIAAVWEVLINGDTQWLANKVSSFVLNVENAKKELDKESKSIKEMAFCTILKNRISHGGIITKGAGMIKNGENGKGIQSRWYPKTLKNRMLAIEQVKNKISFFKDDAFKILEFRKNDKDVYFFIDPPYTKAGKRLYTYSELDHNELFKITSELSGKFMLTYDDTPEIRELVKKYDLSFRTIPMKTTHHIKKQEIIVSDNFDWWD